MFSNRACQISQLLLLILPPVVAAETVEVHFEATAQTVVGMPFGRTVPRLTTATGSFLYETGTADTNATASRGDYPHPAGGGFGIRFLDTEVTGSPTPFVQIEDLSTDTFRFIDGLRPVGNQGGIMKVDGTADSTVELLIAISKSGGDAFVGDALPNPFPFLHRGSPFPVPHTFSLKDAGGTLLFQFTRTFVIAGPVIEHITKADASPLVTVRWRGHFGVAHRIEFSEDFETWITVGDAIVAGPGQNSFEDRLDLRYPDSLPVEGHYRIRAL